MKLNTRTVVDKSLSAASILLMSLFVFSYCDVQKQPYRFSEETYFPKVANVCPGDSLTYETKLSVLKVPLVLTRARTVYSVEGKTTVLPAKSEDQLTFNWDKNIAKTFARTYNVKVPKLNPGNYRYLVSLRSDNKPPAIYAVPFTIKANCPS